MFSAAQALYLAQCAQMNDLEFEAFRINTARTQLSQESNRLGDLMAGLDLPVPPSMNDFTQIQYTFAIGTDTMTIENVRPNGGYYNVTVAYDRIDHYMDEVAATYIMRDDSGYYVNNIQHTRLELLNDHGAIDSDYYQAIRNTFPEYADADDAALNMEFYVYQDPNQSSREFLHFLKRTDVEATDTSYTPSGRAVNTYDYIANGSHTEREEIQGCMLEFDSSGRITAIKIERAQGRLATYPVTSQTISDEAGYNDAYNQYQYQKYQYDQEQVRLEQEIEVIQRQDKNLEMKLAKLENLRNALKSEMEGTKKVIEDATEGFKTFA